MWATQGPQGEIISNRLDRNAIAWPEVLTLDGSGVCVRAEGGAGREGQPTGGAPDRNGA